ncbi:MAG: Gfo/Idh/MocA family oxidoreductase [Acidobacteria bacterium]|nr:Gfo/Idh/MocA family oxidoreductase [Acidobacteriota bacterium]MBI3657320.1 Gfo/Idh/MocA family oxidoreductase [Acidobacteriota bacterium]
MRPIKCGIIGVGFVGAHHIEAVRRLGFVEVVALAGSSLDSAKAKAEKYHIPKAYGSYAELLNDSEIEVIHNTTPNYLHYPVNAAAAQAGKHIISDKPLGRNAREAKLMLEAVQAAGIVHAVVFNYRYNPMVQEMRQRMRRGDLGEIYYAHGDYLQDWLLYPTDYNWRLEPEQSGESRALGDIGSHWCDLAQYVTGLRIVKVLANFTTIHQERRRPQGPLETFSGVGKQLDTYQSYKVTSEDAATVLVKFSNGGHGVFTVTQISAGHKNHLRIEVDCAKGSMAWDQERPNALWLGYRERANEVMLKDPNLLDPAIRHYAALPGGHNEAWPDALKNLFSNVYQFIAAGHHPVKDKVKIEFPTFEDGYLENAIVDAAVVSHRQGNRWVDVSV